MGQLVVVPGIITAASRTSIKATEVCIKCSNCGHQKILQMKAGFGGTAIPRQCESGAAGLDKQRCPLDPYKIVADKSTFMDQQTLKVQELPELIPTGEMPRTFLMIANRDLTDKVTPGNRVTVVGILSTHNKSE